MRTTMRTWAGVVAVVLTVGAVAAAQAGPAPGADEAAVRAAVLDYVEGVYEVAPERIERSVHPTLRKHGYFTRDGVYTDAPMTYEELVELARTYNAEGRIPADAPKEIEVYEVLDKTASARLTAAWGVDFFHLAKLDGRWMIMNVLWQSPPPSE